jgi:hypothetical protein
MKIQITTFSGLILSTKKKLLVIMKSNLVLKD